MDKLKSSAIANMKKPSSLFELHSRLYTYIVLIEYKIYDKIYLQRLFAVFFMTIYLKTKKKKSR